MTARRRMFPVLLTHWERLRMPSCPREVPWEMLAPHEAMAKWNHRQTLYRLAERGGLGISEMVAVVDGIRLRDLGDKAEEAWLPRLMELLDAFERGRP